MWRPVALSAFLALLFMSSRSGQEPVELQTNETAKTDYGAEETAAREDAPKVRIDPARSSEFEKTESEQTPVKAREQDSPAKTLDDAPDEVELAQTTARGQQTIPLPSPKSGDGFEVTRVVVAQGEQKTALTNGEDALRLLPPGPDFAAKVQRELARLGCYRGRIDNIWGPMSRNAVARFNRVAEGKLPLKQPTRALLSSTRKAPDGYCKNGGERRGSRVAALDPGAGLEALKERPEYLPPWMRGEGMPEPEDEPVVSETEAEASPEASTAAPTNAQRERAQRPKRVRARRTRRTRARRRVRQRRAQSFSAEMDGRGSFWPGQH